ncbi:unnamed protein product [Prunus brigantina]
MNGQHNGIGRAIAIDPNHVMVEDITEADGRSGAGVNFACPHINQFAGIGGWNNLGGNANLNNPLLGNQAIDRGAIEQMIQDMVPHARRIGRPVYRRPYPEHFDLEEFPRGFKVPDFALFSGDGFQSTVEHIGRFTAQCAEIGHREALKLRLFPSTLTGAAFSWYNNKRTGQHLGRPFIEIYQNLPHLEPRLSMRWILKMWTRRNETKKSSKRKKKNRLE